MRQFTADLWCRRCKKVTPHRVYYIHLHGDPPDMYVQIGTLCIRINQDRPCSRYYEHMLKVKDYNALITMAKEDYPTDFEDR